MPLSDEECYLMEMPEEEVIALAGGQSWYLRSDDEPKSQDNGLKARNYWFVSEYCHKGNKPLIGFDLYRAKSAPVLEVAKAELVQWILGAQSLICKLLRREVDVTAQAEARIQELELALALAMRSKSDKWPSVIDWHARHERDTLIGSIPVVLDYIKTLEEGGARLPRPDVLKKWESGYRERAEALYREWEADIMRRREAQREQGGSDAR